MIYTYIWVCACVCVSRRIERAAAAVVIVQKVVFSRYTYTLLPNKTLILYDFGRPDFNFENEF